MADVKLKFGQEVEFGKVDSVLTVSDGAQGKLGELHFSKGSVEWWPAGNSVKCRTYNWAQLADVLGNNGVEIRATKAM